MNLTTHPSFWENLRFQTVGLAIVLAALGFMALVFSIIGWFFKNWGDRKPSPGTGAISAPPEASAQGIAPEVVAVIAAAVDSVISERHRIVSIRPVGESETAGRQYLQAWSVEGRRQHFASHKVR